MQTKPTTAFSNLDPSIIHRELNIGLISWETSHRTDRAIVPNREQVYLYQNPSQRSEDTNSSPEPRNRDPNEAHSNSRSKRYIAEKWTRKGQSVKNWEPSMARWVPANRSKAVDQTGLNCDDLSTRPIATSVSRIFP
jgi:hypothetical protein